MRKVVLLVTLIIVCIFLAQDDGRATATDARKIVRIGTIGRDIRDETRILLPLVNYLNTRPELSAKYQFETAVAKSLEEMAIKLKNEEVLLYIDSPFPVFQIMSSLDLELIARRWKKGVYQYNSVIFVNKQSGISSVEQLKGEIIEFGEPFSSSSYGLPKGDLLAKGLTFTKLDNRDTVFSEDHVGYLFNTDREKSFLRVFKTEIMAGAIDNITYENIPQLVKKNLEVIHRTKSIPRHLVCCLQKTDRELIDDLKNVLFSMTASDEGKTVLRSFENTIKFDPIPKEKILRKYMSKLITLLRENKDTT